MPGLNLQRRVRRHIENSLTSPYKTDLGVIFGHFVERVHDPSPGRITVYDDNTDV